MCDKGDKFIIEIVEVFSGDDYVTDGENLYSCKPTRSYRVRGIDGLTFSEAILEKLTPFDEARPAWWTDAYKQGVDEAWRAARAIDGVSVEELATAIVPLYEKIQKISVGDECRYKKSSTGECFIVTRVYYEGENGFFDGVWPDGSLCEDGSLHLIERTGRRFPQIIEALNQMKEGNKGGN